MKTVHVGLYDMEFSVDNGVSVDLVPHSFSTKLHDSEVQISSDLFFSIERTSFRARSKDLRRFYVVTRGNIADVPIAKFIETLRDRNVFEPSKQMVKDLKRN